MGGRLLQFTTVATPRIRERADIGPCKRGDIGSRKRGDIGQILRLAECRGAENVRVFGSVARGEAGADSDVDLLVAWKQGRSLFDHAGLVADLQDLLGMKVHVGTEQALHRYVCERILREATPL